MKQIQKQKTLKKPPTKKRSIVGIRSSSRRTAADQGFRCSNCTTTGNMLYISVDCDIEVSANRSKNQKLILKMKKSLFCSSCCHNRSNAKKTKVNKEWTPITPIDFQRVIHDISATVVNDVDSDASDASSLRRFFDLLTGRLKRHVLWFVYQRFFGSAVVVGTQNGVARMCSKI